MWPGKVIWFTGIPSAGKTTLANKLAATLEKMGARVIQLDGDVIRSTPLANEVSFTNEDRRKHILRMGLIAKMLSDQGSIVICSFVSPHAEIRRKLRLMMPSKFVEVYVYCPLDVAESRDTKGLYKKARAGEIKLFTGIDALYEEPENPHIRIDTTKMNVRTSVHEIIDFFIL